MEKAVLEVLCADAEGKLLMACEEIIDLKRQLKIVTDVADAAEPAVEALEKMNEELAVLHAFWKTAAERALRLWERAQAKNDALTEAVGKVLQDETTSLSLASWHALEAFLEE